MSKPLSFLVLLATVLVPAPARALPTQDLYQVRYGGNPGGFVVFDLDAWGPGACEYLMSWDYGAGFYGEQCVVDEATSFGHGSCFVNAFVPVASVITLSPGWDCWGFDAGGQDTQVYFLVLGENGRDGSLDGIIQLGDAASPLVGFHAAPVPMQGDTLFQTALLP